MKRADMVCKTCIKFDGKVCRFAPNPFYLGSDYDHYRNASIHLFPDEHWCSQGEWREPSRYDPNLMVPVYWGQSEEDRLYNPLHEGVSE